MSKRSANVPWQRQVNDSQPSEFDRKVIIEVCAPVAAVAAAADDLALLLADRRLSDDRSLIRQTPENTRLSDRR